MPWPFTRREAVTAAVQPLDPSWVRIAPKAKQQWWERARFFSENLGAIRFACGIKADAGSRCTLQVEKQVDPRKDEWEPVTNDLVPVDVLHAYRGKDTDQRELVRAHIWGYDTLGEVVQLIEAENGEVFFTIRSPLSVDWKKDTVIVKDIPGATVRDGTARVYPLEAAKRLYVKDDTFPGIATSPLRGVLKDCERYWSIQRRMQRTADSALGMAKILWTPSEAHTELASGQQGPGSTGPGTKLEQEYYKLAGRAFSDDDNVESIVPPMFRWAQQLGEPKTVDLSQPFDDKAIAYRTEALECIGRGLDYPQRLLVSGGADTNHWTSWLLEESFAKNSLAPTMERVCWGDLTRSFLRPALEAVRARGRWDGDPTRYRVGFDMAPIVVHPNQFADALELYKLGVLSDAALLDVGGFDTTTAPDQNELERWIVRTQIMAKSAPPGGLPVDEATVQRDIPAQPALAAASSVRETIVLGPYASERGSWLD